VQGNKLNLRWYSLFYKKDKRLVNDIKVEEKRAFWGENAIWTERIISFGGPQA